MDALFYYKIYSLYYFLVRIVLRDLTGTSCCCFYAIHKESLRFSVMVEYFLESRVDQFPIIHLNKTEQIVFF